MEHPEPTLPISPGRRWLRIWLLPVAAPLAVLLLALWAGISWERLEAGFLSLTAVQDGFIASLVAGLVEPVGGLFGIGLVTLSQPLLPWGLAFAGGAMLFVVSHDIIPESHRKGHESHATAGVMLGFMVMMVLDIALG